MVLLCRALINAGHSAHLLADAATLFFSLVWLHLAVYLLRRPWAAGHWHWRAG
jgi:hypothetical protein